MKHTPAHDGFFLLDAVISLAVITVFIISILVFILGAFASVIKTRKTAERIIQERNIYAASVYENTR